MKGFSPVKILTVFFAGMLFSNIYSQCISTFPNTQDFESAAAWTTGGSNNDWAWGTPSKSTINSAGGGSKCWITGGLSPGAYNGGQQSYIESPCYNFSSLIAPVVSFKIFWETEFQYDGGSLQYSINGGSWTTIGDAVSASSCMNQKWYDYANINYLSWCGNKQGWSGNSKPNSGSCVGGNGSMGWVTAKRCISSLAGQSNVKFRFTFGSGTSCNNFDGLAIDDFTIEDGQASSISFVNACNSFTVVDGGGCMASGAYNWNFGDPNSGSANTSTVSSPVHFYSNPGIYTVSVSSPASLCGGTSIYTKTISILGSAITGISDVTCKGGNNGSATVTAISGGSGLTYSWTPEGGNSNVASSLPAGDYSVIIQDANGCKSSSSVTINEPNSSTGTTSQTITSCIGDNTLLQVNTSGITDPITYLWTPGGYTTSSVYVAPSTSTTYTVNLNISGACAHTEQKFFTNIVSPKPLIAIESTANKGCAPLCINLTDKSSTTVGNITSWNWSFSNAVYDNAQNQSICFNEPGTYTISHGATNSIGCSNTVFNILTVTVYPTPIVEFTTEKFVTTESNPIVQFQNASVNLTSTPYTFEWNFGEGTSSTETNPVFNFNAIGNYPVMLTATNEFGCSNSVIRNVKVEPEFTFFAPNSFTPNDDNVNDVFLPKGMAWDTETYQLNIYNRWGQLIFSTRDYTQGWNGKVKGNSEVSANDTYVWKVDLFDIHKKARQFTGSVTIVR